MIGSRLAHYRILERLGSGAMGEFFLAEDTRLGREVALKTLPAAVAADPARRERFRREARALAALEHPAIVTIFSVEEADGVHFLTMERVRGRTLAETLPPAGFDLAEVLRLAHPLADAIAAAHARGIVHRDLKPGNLMRTASGRLKVLDFGLAKMADPGVTSTELASASTEVALTFEGTSLGTPAYMSPEQVLGAQVDERSDLFSLGAVLFELATGRRAFDGASRAEVMAAILRDDPPELALVGSEPAPSALAAAVKRCLAKRPEDRFPSAAELAEALAAVAPSKAAAAANAREPSVAVLPFANLSADPEQEYFCDGMAEEVINALSRVAGLKVVARTSAFAFKGRNEDAREIGRRLGVGHLVEGSVGRALERRLDGTRRPRLELPPLR